MKFDLRVIFCAFITWLNSINILLYNLGVFSLLEVFPREKLDLNHATLLSRLRVTVFTSCFVKDF